MNSHSLVIGQEINWQNLLEGNTLENFVQLNGKADFSIEDGVLIGTSKRNTPNSFLATKKNYSKKRAALVLMDSWHGFEDEAFEKKSFDY